MTSNRLLLIGTTVALFHVGCGSDSGTTSQGQSARAAGTAGKSSGSSAGLGGSVSSVAGAGSSSASAAGSPSAGSNTAGVANTPTAGAGTAGVAVVAGRSGAGAGTGGTAVGKAGASAGSGGSATAGSATGGATSGGSGGSSAAGKAGSGGTATGGTGGVGGSSSAGKGGASAGSGGTATGGAAGSAGSGGLLALHVTGTQLLNSNNQQVILRGADTIDISEANNFTGISTAIGQVQNAIDLVTGTGWNTHVIRLAVYGTGARNSSTGYAYPEGGTTAAQDTWFNAVVKPAVDYATGKGLYVIIDWHEVNSASGRDSATKGFWTYMAPKYANVPNVLYEVFNEDSDTNSWTNFQPYAQGWVNIVRTAGANNIVLVGGPTWDQTIGGSATTPVTGGNVVYVAHMYPEHYSNTTTRANIASQIQQAAAAAPVFFTEWGYNGSAASNAGYVTWVKGLASTYNASWSAWVISPSWGPPMYNADKTPNDFGNEVKTWLSQYP